MNIYTKLEKRYEQVGDDFLAWAKDIESLFDRASKRLTASLTWEFINKQLKRKIEKWYDLVQDAIDDTEVLLVDNDMEEITSEIEAAIRKKFDPRLRKYQKEGNDIIEKYQEMSNNITPEVWDELTTIVFEIETDNILNILKEMFHE
jgi:gas vesicle protein